MDYTVLVADIGLGEPTEYGERWRSTTWNFTRLMKFHPDLRNLSADEALERIPWRLTDFPEDERLQVLVEWDRVKYLPGQGPLDVSLSLATQKPLVPKRCEGGKFTLYASFISFCGWLQVLVGEGEPIYLPVRNVANVLCSNKEMISSLRKLAVKDRILQIHTSHTTHRATRFLFDLSKFPILREWRH